MMFNKCSNFHYCILRSFNFIETVYELFDNPSYVIISEFLILYIPHWWKLLFFLAHLSWKLKWAFLITCCLSVRPSVCLSVNFSQFHLLFQNHWANFNQTWHKLLFTKCTTLKFLPNGRCRNASAETIAYEYLHSLLYNFNLNWEVNKKWMVNIK